jgi:hypothetical protein
MTCPTCGEAARFERWRDKAVVLLLGPIRVDRAYYHCRHCQSGHCPRDAQLRLGPRDLSPGAAWVTAVAGVLGSFAEAATKTLVGLCGLRLSESTVQRVTEQIGAAVGERLAAGETFGGATGWAWAKDAEGKTLACVSVDSTGVGMQGPKGARADGRMAAVGMVWNPGREGQVRYVCGMTGGVAGLAEPLRNQAAQVGMDRAERWVAISDGGSGLEDWLRLNFPRAEAVVLDFYHAAEHLCDWAKALHADETEATAVGAAWCHRLKHEGGAAVLADVRAVDVRDRSEVVRDAHREVLGYFENQVHRMDYPYYRAKGWPIGSGPVEAACKQVVNQRLKGTGMRWGEVGADAVCHLRALFRSEKGQWESCMASLAM